MTTQQGIPISDDQNTLTHGDRGRQLLEDFVMREKISSRDPFQRAGDRTDVSVRFSTVGGNKGLAAGLDDSRRDTGYVDVDPTQKSSAASVDVLAALRYRDRTFTA